MLDCCRVYGVMKLSRSVHRHCEPTGPARSGRPDDKLREAIQCGGAVLDCFVASLLAMTSEWVDLNHHARRFASKKADGVEQLGDFIKLSFHIEQDLDGSLGVAGVDPRLCALCHFGHGVQELADAVDQ